MDVEMGCGTRQGAIMEGDNLECFGGQAARKGHRQLETGSNSEEDGCRVNVLLKFTFC